MDFTALKKAMIAGIAGTVAMTVYAFAADFVHLPRVDFHSLIAAFVPTSPLGTWLVYFGVGIALAYLYRAQFQSRLPAHSTMRGIIYGLCVWAVFGLVVMPVFGLGFFSGSTNTALGMLLGMASYGATVGYLYEHS